MDRERRRDPGETSPAKLFKALFIQGTEQEVAAEMKNFQRGRSILDTVLGEAKSLERELGARDREKLDEYLASVRELEVRLQQSKAGCRSRNRRSRRRRRRTCRTGTTPSRDSDS